MPEAMDDFGVSVSLNGHFMIDKHEKKSWLHVWDIHGMTPIICLEDIGIPSHKYYTVPSNDGCKFVWRTNEKLFWAEISNATLSRTISVPHPRSTLLRCPLVLDCTGNRVFCMSRTLIFETEVLNSWNPLDGSSHRISVDVRDPWFIEAHPSNPGLVAVRTLGSKTEMPWIHVVAVDQLGRMAAIPAPALGSGFSWFHGGSYALIWDMCSSSRWPQGTSLREWNTSSIDVGKVLIKRSVGLDFSGSVARAFVPSSNAVYLQRQVIRGTKLSMCITKWDLSKNEYEDLLWFRKRHSEAAHLVLPVCKDQPVKDSDSFDRRSGASLCKLPDDLLFILAGELSIHSLLSLSSTSRQMRVMIQADSTWKALSTSKTSGWGDLMTLLKATEANRDKTWKEFYIDRFMHLQQNVCFVGFDTPGKVFHFTKPSTE